MAIDNLNYYSNWLPAWQQTDKYSNQPWCLRSKNLDIFSSSKSVKATAWSNPSQWAADIIKQDGVLILKTDGKVYDISTWTEVLVVDPAANFPAYKVSYTWKNGTYADAQRWTPEDLVVKYEWDERKSFVVYTDKSAFNYSKTKYVWNKSFTYDGSLTYDSSSPFQDQYGSWYLFKKTSTTWTYPSIYLKLEWGNFGSFPIHLSAYEPDTTQATISVQDVTLKNIPTYYYDAELDSMVTYYSWATSQTLSFSWDLTNWGIDIDVPLHPTKDILYLQIDLKFTKRNSNNDLSWIWGEFFLDMNNDTDNWKMGVIWAKSDWDSNYYYSYLPNRDRKLTEVWEYYWLPATTFQTLYNWEWTWVEVNWQKQVRYDFVQYMWWANDPAMTVVGMIVWNEQVYMIWNMNWNWYIIPCDLAWSRWTPYIAYWCEFKWVANIDYLMYLVGEDRGISNLRVYNWQELVSIIGWNKESNLVDYIDTAEQYKFDWKMVEYRGDLVLATSDNRIFQYWQTFGGKGGTFIHEVPWSITELKADWKNLVVKYTSWANNYAIAYQDDVIAKNYNTEWEAEYPIVLWNHLLEKEESDLYASYILPNSSCKLEFWGCANHYHFWTFKSSDSYTFSTTASYKMKGCTWNYVLKFIEKNDNYYTFRLEGDLPLQTVSGMKITDTEWTELITYSEYNHFRKIWEITTSGYSEWEFRFTNINNRLELPKSHSLQILVRGKGTANYTPELFALDLVANQRDRW